MKLKLLILVLLVNLGNSAVSRSQSINQPVVATYGDTKLENWCNTGEFFFYWSFWAEDADSSGTADWEFVDAYFNMGDGTTIHYTDQNFGPVTHTYNTTGVVEITGYANFISIYGNTITVEILDYVDPTLNSAWHLFDSPSTPTYNSLEIDIQTVVPSLDVEVSNGTVDFTSYSALSPSSQSTNNWSYELFLEGNPVASGSTFPSYGSAIHSDNLSAGQYAAELVLTFDNDSTECSKSVFETFEVVLEDTCEECSSFKPIPGKEYWISAWVKEDRVSQVKQYVNSSLRLNFYDGSNLTNINFSPTGEIIDGWQRIVGSFKMPYGTINIGIELVNNNSGVDAYFDDIRIHPYNGSMKSYVYDPETLWLTAELDDNNYATFYEYDKEGKLIRIKKETSKGIMTIQESRSRTLKKAVNGNN